MDTKQVVREAGIPEEDYGLANANINYLEESSLIKGIKTIGAKHILNGFPSTP